MFESFVENWVLKISKKFHFHLNFWHLCCAIFKEIVVFVSTFLIFFIFEVIFIISVCGKSWNIEKYFDYNLYFQWSFERNFRRNMKSFRMSFKYQCNRSTYLWLNRFIGKFLSERSVGKTSLHLSLLKGWKPNIGQWMWMEMITWLHREFCKLTLKAASGRGQQISMLKDDCHSYIFFTSFWTLEPLICIICCLYVGVDNSQTIFCFYKAIACSESSQDEPANVR